MKIKTKSGFECEINERKFSDWRYLEASTKVNSTDTKAILDGIVFLVPFILGEDGKNALMNHLKDDDGIVETASILAEFREIEDLVGKKVKKSKPSSD